MEELVYFVTQGVVACVILVFFWISFPFVGMVRIYSAMVIVAAVLHCKRRTRALSRINVYENVERGSLPILFLSSHQIHQRIAQQ